MKKAKGQILHKLNNHSGSVLLPLPSSRFISLPLPLVTNSSLLFIVIKCAFTQITSRRANFPTAARVFYVIFINNEC